MPERITPLILLIAFMALVVRVPDASGQPSIPNAQMAGTDYSSASLVTGIDALGVNPSLITPPKGKVLSIAIAPFSLRAGTDFLSYDAYVRYFTGTMGSDRLLHPTYLTTADKQTLLAAFDGSDGTIVTDDQLRLIAFTANTGPISFGVDISDRLLSSATVPKALVEFLLFGNTPGRTFDLQTTRIESSWIRDYGLTLAHRFDIDARRQRSIAIGASLKYLQGFAYFSVDRFNSVFTTDPDSFVISGTADLRSRYAGTEWIVDRDISQFSLFPEPVGSGFGMDIGVTLRLSESFACAATLTDFGWMTWNRNAREISASEQFTISNMASDRQLDEITDRLNGKEHAIASFSSALPSAVTLSGAFTIPSLFGKGKPAHLTVALREGLSDELGNSTVPRIAAGTELHLASYFALRLGASAGGLLPPSAACGISLRMHQLTLDLATNNIETFLSRQFSVMSFSAGGRLDF